MNYVHIFMMKFYLNTREFKKFKNSKFKKILMRNQFSTRCFLFRFRSWMTAISNPFTHSSKATVENGISFQ